MDLTFRTIKIDGYRGRHFELVMPADEDHAVFVMDGNTGKTTTIELLRWCLRYRESKAEGNFNHMWAHSTYVLDHAIEGRQECTIQVEFVDEESNHYKFERKTIGEHRREREHENNSGDLIESVSDSLEINRGQNVITGDDVNELLNSKFRLRVSAEYCCFDGEKARDMIRMASSRVHELIELIRQRTTHSQVQKYLDMLDELKDRLLFESEATLSDRAQKITEGKLRKLKRDRDEVRNTILGLEDDKAVYEQETSKLKDEIDELTGKIRDAKSEKVGLKVELENRRDQLKAEMARTREEVYKNCRIWVDLSSYDLAIKVKEKVRERGKFPQPYHGDLIELCLEEPPTCQICGRLLDEESVEQIRQLSQQVASHEIQTFLSSSIFSEDIEYDPKEDRIRIREISKELKEVEKDYRIITLDTEDEKMFHSKTALSRKLGEFQDLLGQIKERLKTEKEVLRMYEDDIEQVYSRSEAFKQNKPLLDKIEELQQSLELAHENMRKRTIEVIGEVISKAVSNILGKRFSAILTEEGGLMLGEDGYYNPEVGGYSGRLILSYLFAETMSQVNPIIIDTPVGNIGSHRDALAKHLTDNHSQVILLCLPTELAGFAEHFYSSFDAMQVITNEE